MLAQDKTEVNSLRHLALVLLFTCSQRLLNYLSFQSFDYDEGYSRNVSASWPPLIRFLRFYKKNNASHSYKKERKIDKCIPYLDTGFVIRVTRRVPRVKQEHWGCTWVHLRFLVGFACSFLSSLYSVFVLFVLFLLVSSNSSCIKYVVYQNVENVVRTCIWCLPL